MNDFLKFFSTAPVILTLWLSITSAFIIFINFELWFYLKYLQFL